MSKRTHADIMNDAADALYEEARSLKEAYTSDSGWPEHTQYIYQQYRHLCQLSNELHQTRIELYPDTGDSDEPKQHWWAMSFKGHALDADSIREAFAYIGFPDERLTIPRINEAKKLATVKDDAVLITATYMGYMTYAAIYQ